MYSDTIDHFAKLAKVKAALLKNNPMSFIIGALMAGAYLGMGIVLVFTVAGQLDPSIRPMVMGMSFGIALTLVIFAGSVTFYRPYHVYDNWLVKRTVTGMRY